MLLRLATWNVNSIRRRLDGLARLVAAAGPDVVCLQETKVTDGEFPHEAVAGLGFPHRAVRGQKGYNGVAILSKYPLEGGDGRNWCGLDDCRHLAAAVKLPGAEPVEIHSFYVPAGGDVPNPETNPKFAHKLAFLDEFAAWSRGCRDGAGRTVLAGDLNVAPLVSDVWSHERLRRVVTHTDVERDKLMRVLDRGGWIDAIRHFVPDDQPLYTWWSYRAPDWEAADKGRRLDHVWVSPDLKGALTGMTILRAARGWAPPSDHVPVVVTLDL